MYIVSVRYIYVCIYGYIFYFRIANCLYSLFGALMMCWLDGFFDISLLLRAVAGAAVAILLCSYPVIIITTAAIREAAHKDVSLDYHN